MTTTQAASSYALSPIQQGMLFHSLNTEQSGIDIEQVLWTLDRDVKVEALRQAWQAAIAQHPVLRTCFDWSGLEGPVQTVRESDVQLETAEEDWSQLSATEQEERLGTYLAEDRSRGFDLAQAPLMRLAIAKLGDNTFKVIWTFHHILLDSHSLPLILEAVWGNYAAICQGEDLPQTSFPAYQDYIDWLQQQDLDRAEGFWREELKGFSAPTPLVTASSATVSEGEANHDREKLLLSPEKTARVKSWAQSHNLTLQTVVQGMWGLLLSRYSSESDVVWGMATSCRRQPTGAESMLGLLLNTLPVRVQVDSNTPVLAWLQSLQEKWEQLREYDYTPLSKILEWSDVPRGADLAESLLVFEEQSLQETMRGRGEAWQGQEFELRHKSSFPLTFSVYGGEQLRLALEYNCARFTPDSIVRMLGHLQTLLEGAIANPQQTLGQLPLLTEVEQQQILVEWNQTQTDYPKDSFVHELFTEQVARTPDAIALEFEGQQLSYRELNRRANQLAHYLQGMGLQPDVLVGLCVERSPEMVVGLLGILKAGAAYVPIDPAYPKERIAHMLSDSEAPLLVTTQDLLPGLPEGQNAKMVFLDADRSAIAQASEENPTSEVQPHHLAYAIYTSGSTGKPKGVMIQHQNLTNFLISMQEKPGLTPSDVLLAVTTISFDIAELELHLPLITGAKVVVVSREVAFDGPKLLAKLSESKATLMQATPASWRLLLAAGWDSQYPVKALCGGEAMPPELAGKILETGSTLWNMYGPTETTIWSTLTQLESNELPICIGRAIANTDIYILDANLQPVPIGVPGELHIGGDGVARGYRNRPKLTAEKFISNPFRPDAGARIYKTGDLARYLPDGTLECLGRIDHQVKIRGFRIEQGEIESVLVAHPSVKQAVVVAREDEPGDKRLVAYMLANEGEKLVVTDLRRHLLDKLPDYMVPSAFVTLEEMPQTPNGKIDRKALPAPGGDRPELEQAYTAPQNETEQLLAKLWGQALKLDKIGVRDNFFDLGGNSILSLQIVAQIQKELNVSLPIVKMFQYPTISALAEYLSQGSGEKPSYEKVQDRAQRQKAAMARRRKMARRR